MEIQLFIIKLKINRKKTIKNLTDDLLIEYQGNVLSIFNQLLNVGTYLCTTRNCVNNLMNFVYAFKHSLLNRDIYIVINIKCVL